MKNLIICTIVLMSATVCLAQSQQKLYHLKSGYVEYDLSGNAEGKKKLWWDDYGAKTRTEIESTSTTKIFGVTQENITNSVEIKNGTNFWTVDLNTMTGEESSMEGLIDYSDFEEMSEKEIEEYSQAVLDSLGGEKLPSEMILGCQCDVYSLWGAKVWNCKSVTLKSETNLMGMSSIETATVFKKNIPVDASKFEKIKGVEYTQLGNYLDMLDQFMDDDLDDDYYDDEEDD
jgi:hypothetical protein